MLSSRMLCDTERCPRARRRRRARVRRSEAREIDRVAARHHLVVIAVRHQHRVANARQIVRRLMRPRAYRLQLRGESGDRHRRVAILGPLFQSAEKVTGRAAAIQSLAK